MHKIFSYGLLACMILCIFVLLQKIKKVNKLSGEIEQMTEIAYNHGYNFAIQNIGNKLKNEGFAGVIVDSMQIDGYVYYQLNIAKPVIKKIMVDF